MKKLLLSLTFGVALYYTNTQSISVSEYIQECGMPTITGHTLDLASENLTSLEGLEDIPNLNLITKLNLPHNQLQSLPNAIFDNLAQLRELNLSANKLQMLPDNIFDNLAQLRRLHLSNNKLQTLSAHIFNKLAQLRELDLDSNRLQSLPETIFDNLAQLEMLYLNTNRLQTLPANIFDNLAQLKELYLCTNRLQTLPANIFDNLAQLKELYLTYNKLQTLPANIFNNLAQFRWLVLYGNQLQGTTQQFREAYLANRANFHLDFKSEAQEESEALEQKYFQAIASIPLNAKQEKVNLIKTLKDLGDASYLDIVPSRDDRGNTLLHKSLLLGNPLLAKLIAQRWPLMVVAINTLGRTPLHVAATLKNRTIALHTFKELLAASSTPEQLLQIKDIAGDTPLRLAVENLQMPILQHLLAFEDSNNTGQLGKSCKLNALLQQPDLATAFKALARVREKVSNQQEKKEACPICFESDTEAKATLPCKHNSFHVACIEQWREMKANSTCPLCRSSI